MIAKRLFQISFFKSICSPTPKMAFSQKTWKDRQQSAEKVFINTQEKKTLSKLLHKLEEQQINQESKQTQFEERLREIVAHHKIPNQGAFISEIINLHKNL